jgi:hypothetical protein
MRQLQETRLPSQDAIARSRHMAAMIAATQDRVAATFMLLARQKPPHADHLMALSRIAREQAACYRGLTGAH